jgi:hypothetical protein
MDNLTEWQAAIILAGDLWSSDNSESLWGRLNEGVRLWTNKDYIQSRRSK